MSEIFGWKFSLGFGCLMFLFMGVLFVPVILMNYGVTSSVSILITSVEERSGFLMPETTIIYGTDRSYTILSHDHNFVVGHTYLLLLEGTSFNRFNLIMMEDITQ